MRVRLRDGSSQLKLLGHFNRVADSSSMGIHELNDELVDTFVKSARAADACTVATRHSSSVSHPSPDTRRADAIGPGGRRFATRPVAARVRAVLDAERGLAPVTVSDYVDVLRSS